jgi:hypothetical protein
MMKLLMKRFRPSLPPVAVLMEAPAVMALRVTKPGRGMQPLVKDEEAMAAIVDSAAPGEAAGARLADSTLTRLGRPKRLSLVLGDPFFRMQIMTLNDFPRNEEERIQVIKWHLRKTLNVPVESLRLHYEILQKTPGGVTLWLSGCQEDAVLALEGAFAAHGCEVGYVGSSTAEVHNLVLARGLYPEEGSALLLNRTAGYLSFLFSEGGRPVFFRCKETPSDEDGEMMDARIEQELRLTLAYHRDKLGGGRLAKVLVRSQAPHMTLPLDSVLEEGIPVEDVASAAGLADQWSPVWLPLVGLLEGN